LKFTWLSNAPWASTGYGDQTALFLKHIREAGHNPAIIAFYGLHGGILQWQGMPVFPKGHQDYGQDIAAAHTKQYGAKYLFSLVDAWVFNNSPFFDSVRELKIRWIPYFPVDSEPLPQFVKVAVERAYRRIVFSKHGAKMMEQAGLDYHYIPHAVDTKILQPQDRAESFDKLKRAGTPLPEDAFIVGMVAANKGAPSRKAFTQNIQAFIEFKRKHRDAVLYLHTSRSENGEYNGVNLPEFCTLMGLEVGRDVFFPDQYSYYLGYPKSYLANLYSLMDVHLLASTGEGFGIPIVEAQACGAPVIVGDWTAMGELCFSGWKIPKEESEPVWTPLAAFQFTPRVGAIVDALEQAYSKRGNPQYRTKARLGALDYDADTVVNRYWLPFLKQLEEDDEAAEKELAAVRDMTGKRVSVNV
jgi:glycosyltransferase involved in cell wall biosynthesis